MREKKSFLFTVLIFISKNFPSPLLLRNYPYAIMTSIHVGRSTMVAQLSIIRCLCRVKGCTLWTLPRSIDRHDSRIKTTMWRKSVVYEFWKIHPDKGRFSFGVATYFLFLFWNGENYVKTKNPSMTPVKKKRSIKLDFWIQGSGYLLRKYLMQGSTPLGLGFGLY